MEIEYSFLNIDTDCALDIGYVRKLTVRYVLTKNGEKRYLAAECPHNNKTETCHRCLEKIVDDLNRKVLSK